MNLNSILKILKRSKLVTAIAVLFVFMPVITLAAYKIENIGASDVLNKDFVVGPGKVEVELSPGESKIVPITVTNRMGESKFFSLEIEDFKGSEDPSQAVVLLGEDRGPYSLKDYLKFEATTFELKNGERATIPVTVSLPTDAEPGGRYGSVLVSTVTKPSSAAQSSAIVSRLGVLFFVTTPGAVKNDGQLAGFKTQNDQHIYGGGPINFRLLYRNNGSVHVDPYGEVRIKNIIGEEVGFVEVDPWFALPMSMRLREISWNRPFLFGRYTAVASINRGYDNIIDTASLTFWVIPWKIATAVFAGILVLVLMIRFIFSRFEFKRKS